MLKLPIGYDHFGRIVRDGMDFVDKSLLIKEIIDRMNVQVSVIVRPRRFGKTLNLSMLQHFFAKEVLGESTDGLFNNLKISQTGDEYLGHRGQYPVIFISFKEVKDHSYTHAYQSLCELISQTYQEHAEVILQSNISDNQKKAFSLILEKKAQETEIGASLLNLCRYLYQVYEVRPWLFIDEYDTPIQAGFSHGYYDPIINIMRQLLGASLKNNDFLHRAVITGILRIAKENLFSGVNNLKVYSLIDQTYSEYFGFTDAETQVLLEKAQLTHHYPTIRHWYNGYQIGGKEIYNPWSLVNCIEEQGLTKPYWVNTSGNTLIKDVLARSDEVIKAQLEQLIKHQSINAIIDENMIFTDLTQNADALWSLLLFSGYLTPTHCEQNDLGTECTLRIPNQEILTLYYKIMTGWLSAPLGNQQYQSFLLSLVEGRVEEFSRRLQRYLLETASIFDISGHEPEKFYHGLVLGMMVSLNETHEIESNRESGYGRYDVMIIPKNRQKLGIILEFKVASPKENDLEAAAQEALKQIQDRRYAATLQQKGIHHLLEIGLAFRNKSVSLAFSATDKR
jgi:Predicted AAA-ATPase/PD-(D/E)XK nuclease superfamily